MWTLWLALSSASDLDAVVAALSVRELSEPCDAAAAVVDPGALPALLVRAADEVAYPPWVGVRAAECATAHVADPDVDRAVRRWIDDPATPGLALAVLAGLDRVPGQVARPLAERLVVRGAADPRVAVRLPERLRSSRHPEIVALAPPLR
jgi:hypothetical protein